MSQSIAATTIAGPATAAFRDCFSAGGLLGALNEEAQSEIGPSLSVREFRAGECLWRAGETARRTFFPLSNLVSIVLPTHEGHAVEVAMVGGEGLVRPALRHRTQCQAFVHKAGRIASIADDDLAAHARSNPEIAAMLRYGEEWLQLQMQNLVACSALHSVIQRLCRWLLAAADRSQGPSIVATHDCISDLLGLRRTTVTHAAQSLQQRGAIRYSRGRIHIRERQLLEEAACECYAATGREHWPSVRLRAFTAEPAVGARPAPSLEQPTA